MSHAFLTVCSPLRSCTTLIWSKSKGPLKPCAALNLTGLVYGIPSSSLEDGSSWSVWNTSSRTLLTLFTAFSPYSSARCFALFTDFPRNFFSCVLRGGKMDKSIAQGPLLTFTDAFIWLKLWLVIKDTYVLCLSFPPSVSVRAGWDFSSSSDWAASFLPKKRLRSYPKAWKLLAVAQFLQSWCKTSKIQTLIQNQIQPPNLRSTETTTPLSSQHFRALPAKMFNLGLVV